MKAKYNRDDVHTTLRNTFGETVDRARLVVWEKANGIDCYWLKNEAQYRIGRGLYRIPGGSGETVVVTPVVPSVAPAPKVSQPKPVVPVFCQPEPTAPVFTMSATDTVSDIQTRLQDIAKQASVLAKVPAKDPAFVSFGDFDMTYKVIKSKQFYPVFITGPTGNGKTFQVEQACAQLGREYVRCNITMETDEDDLLGGMRLRDGNTFFEVGPVLVAMLRGAVLLLDELDLASPKIMCLQPILEGKGITVKKLGITIAPAPGFTVFATANTKGQGSETGEYIGTGLLNEALLDRFPATVEQAYPKPGTELRILTKSYEIAGGTMTPHASAFFETLTRWAEAIRQTYVAGGVDKTMSTRRLVQIVKGYQIFGDDSMAMGYGCNRYDVKTQEAFQDLYNKLAPDSAAPSTTGDTVVITDDIKF